MEQGSPPGFKHPILWLLIGFKWSRVHPGNLQLAPAQLAGGQRSRSSPSAQQRGWEEDQEKNGLVQTIQHQPPACCVPRDSWKGQPGLGWGSCSCTKGSITHGCTVPGVGAAVVVGPAARTPRVHCGASKDRSCTTSLPHPAPPCCPIHPSTHASGCCRVLVLRGRQGSLHRAPGEAGGGPLELVARQGGEEVLPIPLPRAPCPSGRDGGPVLRAELHKRCPGAGWRCWSWQAPLRGSLPACAGVPCCAKGPGAGALQCLCACSPCSLIRSMLL